MPRDAVSRTANVERTGRHKWVNSDFHYWLNLDNTSLPLGRKISRLNEAQAAQRIRVEFVKIIRETGFSRHHGGSIEFETPR